MLLYSFLIIYFNGNICSQVWTRGQAIRSCKMKEDRETWTDLSGWWTRLLKKNSRIKKSWHWQRSLMQPSPEARVPPRISMMGLSCANRWSNKWRNNIMRHRARWKLRNTFLEQILNVAVWSFGRSPAQSSGPWWDWGCPGFASGNSVFAVDCHFKWSNTVILLEFASGNSVYAVDRHFKWSNTVISTM